MKVYKKKPHLYQQNILDQLETSAINWFTLAKVNWYGLKTITAVNKKMAGYLEDLPTEDEASQMVNKMAKELLGSIDAEDAKMAASMRANPANAMALPAPKGAAPYKINRRP